MIGILELSLIYVLVTFGLYISFRILNFADLTVDGSFTLGAFIAALFMNNPGFALIASFFCGALAGGCTGFFYNRLKIIDILASILVLIALYSINLRIMNTPNVIINTNIDFKYMLFIIIGVSVLFIYFFNSVYGLSMRAAGQNKKCASMYGINVERMISMGLIVSNGLIALSGGMFAFYQGFSDINIGTGTLISGLASVILGEQIFSTNRFSLIAIFCLIGTVLYRFAISLALSFDYFFRPSDINLLTSVLMILLIVISKLRKKTLILSNH